MNIATIQHVDAIFLLYQEIIEIHANLEPEYFKKAEQSKEFIREMIESPDSDILLAYSKQLVVGFSMIKEVETPAYPMMKNRKYAYILDLVVTQSNRGQGLGKELLNDSIVWQKMRQLEYIELCVIEKNNHAKKMYESLGFKTFSRQMILK
ncbi:GNAT family N-acetyltransferase [Vagococcus fluvialis]|uniref:GNAT family N-acetyltransferase n=1 Tax=Vagococcus fluvialis TaxID=2738 RepID=UPI001A90B274|nr:GNAT family N-acetyltransferase [Vagococcus fluvialis]MBO0437484.1 GNAT family N-acetyltransferase [Vagococcus fluvialis]